MLVFLSAGQLSSMNIRTVVVVVIVVVFVIIAVVVVVIFVVVVARFEPTQPHHMMCENAHWDVTRPRLFPTSLGVSERANE